jgi:hypothetical protein
MLKTRFSLLSFSMIFFVFMIQIKLISCCQPNQYVDMDTNLCANCSYDCQCADSFVCTICFAPNTYLDSTTFNGKTICSPCNNGTYDDSLGTYTTPTCSLCSTAISSCDSCTSSTLCTHCTGKLVLSTQKNLCI